MDMAAVTFDTLKCMKRLIEAGVPAEQAEAQAEVLAEAFVHNVDNLVTRDYLDARLQLLEDRFNSKFKYIAFTQAVIVAAVLIPHIKALMGF